MYLKDDSIGDDLFGEVSKQLRLLKHFTSWRWFVHLFCPQVRMITGVDWKCGRDDIKGLGYVEGPEGSSGSRLDAGPETQPHPVRHWSLA